MTAAAPAAEQQRVEFLNGRTQKLVCTGRNDMPCWCQNLSRSGACEATSLLRIGWDPDEPS